MPPRCIRCIDRGAGHVAGATSEAARSEAALRELRRLTQLLVCLLRGNLLICLRWELHGDRVSRPR